MGVRSFGGDALAKDFSGVCAVPFCFGEEEDEADENYAVETDVEPPEAALPEMFGHWASDDGSDLLLVLVLRLNSTK